MSLTRTLKGISRDTLRERVYGELRSAIMKGVFEPGQAVTVRGLAEAFGTSPTPVREALQQLVAETALVAEPNRSYRVPRIARETFQDLRDTRAELEGLAATKATEVITAAEIRKLHQIIERTDRAIQTQDLKAYLASNEDFHFTIYEAARAPILLRTIRMLWVQIGPMLNVLLRDINLVEELQDNHHAILTAFGNKDAEAARQAIRNDILTAADFIEHQPSVFDET